MTPLQAVCAVPREQQPGPAPCYRRLFHIRNRQTGAATAWLEDDFHHFGVRISYHDGIITDVAARVVRAPWSTCPGAATRLGTLIGQALFSRETQIGNVLAMRQNCTHLFDLAGLAIAAAARGQTLHVFEATVTDRVPAPPPGQPHTGFCSATLKRDGADILRWDVLDENIVSGPAPRSLGRGFRAWTETLPEMQAQACGILRRAIEVSGGRSETLDSVSFAADLGLPPLCYSYQPETVSGARRMHGATRDFSAGTGGMLAGIDADF
jgi:hypothetical protein